MIICCAGCENPIMDKFLLTVLDRTWHADCVRCVDCGVLLTDKCFSREGKLFCRPDFFKRFGTKCSGCLQGISPQDLVRKARDRVFHLKCFTCCVCRKQLSTGEELYVLDENKFICKHDYMNGKAIADSYNGAPSEDDDEETLDVKPTIDANTPNPTPPTSITPSMTTSPSGAHIPPPSLQTSSVTPPVPHSIASPGVGPPQTPSFAGLLGRATPPAGLGLGMSGNPVGTPLQDSLGVSFSDTPPSEKDGSSTFHDSDVSDAEGSNEAKDPAAVDAAKLTDDDKNGNKRRGPRTTIKAKQLEVLKSAFASTPKPTRHIREQLAKETGLPMRVIQVWFQNKRSKERRMKQLSSLGMRAHIFGNPRKLRGMRMSPSMEDGYPYYGDAFGYGPQGFHEFFPGQGPPPPPGMGFPHGLPPAMEQPLPPGGPMGDFPPLTGLGGPPISDGSYMSQPPDILSQRSSPDNMILAHGGQGNFDHQASEGLVW